MVMATNTARGAAALLGTWLPLALGIATASGQVAPGEARSGGAGLAPSEASTLSVEFQGGTIMEYIAVLSKAAPDLNVVIRPETKEIPMPPVSLKGVAHGTALQLIPALADSGDEIAVMPVQSPGSGSEVFVIGVKPSRPQGVMPGAVMMHATPAGRTVGRGLPFAGPSGKSVRVFSLRALTSGADALKPETVLTAIDTALGLQGAEEAASIKLHPESGLLVVRGDPTQIDAVEQVLTTMERDFREDFRQQVSAREQALQNENMNLKHAVDALKAKVAELEARLAKTELDLGIDKQK
jgi:hypothetical protein